MNTFKKNYQTSEFITSALFVLVLTALQMLRPLPATSIGLCGVITSYMLSRGMFKRNRTKFIGNGFKTSEFIFYVYGIVDLCVMAKMHWLEPSLAIVLLMAIQASFNFSRGHTKSYSPTNKVHVL